MEIRDALGRPILSRMNDQSEALDGRSLVLSIDRAIQFLAETKLDIHSAAMLYALGIESKKDYEFKVVSSVDLTGIADLKQWFCAQYNCGGASSVKNLSVRRTHKTKTGEDKFEYMLSGKIFIINHDRLFVIEYAYSFCIDSVPTEKNH